MESRTGMLSKLILLLKFIAGGILVTIEILLVYILASDSHPVSLLTWVFAIAIIEVVVIGILFVVYLRRS